MHQSIPFVVLTAVAALLFILLRRTAPTTAGGEVLASPSREVGDAVPAPLPAPEVMAVPTPAAADEAIPMVPVVAAKIAKPRKKPIAKPSQTEATPSETVVGLLQQKNTLAAAFLLREIFDPPLSRRGKNARR